MQALKDSIRAKQSLPLWMGGFVVAISLTLAPGIFVGARAQNPGAVVKDRIPGGEHRGAPELEAIESLLRVASPESGKAVAENAARLTQRWSQLAARLPADVDSSLIVRIWRRETERAIGCFHQALEGSGLTPEARAEVLRLCLEPAHNAEALLPAVDAAARGERSGALVITSVGCECVLNACGRMGALYDSLSAEDPGIPFARFDDMDLPEIAEGWDLYQIPTWVFLEAKGEIGFMLEGTEVDDSTVLSEIRAWTGLREPAARK